jgi:DNA-binding response OmpR family regulator
LPHILLVEDTATLGMSLELSLIEHGHKVTWARTLAEARVSFEETKPELILLDLGLPDGDGFDFCREVRASGCITPIIVVTARETLQSRVEGLSIGADDYVTKPFELPELIARVEAVIRRQLWYGAGQRSQVGRLQYDLRRREAWVDGELASMTELEFNLLQYFLGRPNQPISREELLVRVWGHSASTQTRTVDVFVGRLRRLIETDPSKPVVIINVRGIGYRLCITNSDPPTQETQQTD